jgi:hypothetical protein
MNVSAVDEVSRTGPEQLVPVLAANANRLIKQIRHAAAILADARVIAQHLEHL